MEHNSIKPKFSLEVFEDHAMIRGWLDVKTLDLLFKLCRSYKFTHLTPNDDGEQGFKLVKRDKE